MARLGIYDPNEVNVIIGTRLATGFAEGTFVEVNRNNPKEISASVGARGEYSLAKNRDKSGTISLTLQAESATNIYLNSLVESDAIFPIFIQRNGETVRELVTSPESWVEERPQKSQGADAPSRVWMFGAGSLIQVDSGI